MQLRIAEGPYAVLGLSEYASTEDVRAAFLSLTKQYHPARFGRMASEIQKYSNEVFLGIKAAHDQLQRVLGNSMTRPGAGTGAPFAVDTQRGTNAPQNARRTDQIPQVQRTTGSIPRQPTPPSFASGTDRSSAPMNTPPRGLSRPMNTPSQPIQRPSSPPMNTPPHGMQRPVTPQPGQRPSTPVIARTATPMPARTTPAGGIPVQRSSTPLNQRPGTPPARPSTPGGRSQNPSTPPLNRPPPPSADLNPPTIRHLGAPTQPPASQFDERTALRECMMMLNDRKWTEARVALHTLAAKVPQAKTYRALLCYARGREAHASGRADEAQLEYQRALQLDPALDLAGQALAELNRRR